MQAPMESKPKKPSKRLDLQGIRGLAIIVVLGFHFFPDAFPNGYLGVDQFFVLSGFLMCMLLKRAEAEAPCSLVSLFYSKRFKRILPLYLLVILCSMISLYKFFPDTAIETNKNSATHALLFVSNRPKTSTEDYFQMLSIAIDIFTHTWSLSVEIQFYFLVPVMFVLASRFSQKLQYAYYSAIGLLSFLFYSFSSDTVSFNSVFARIWQFLIGMIVYLATDLKMHNDYIPLTNDEEEGVTEKLVMKVSEDLEDTSPITTRKTDILKYLSLISLVAVTTCPLPLPVSFVRPFVTVFTGLLMLISDEDTILSNRVLTYIGDISYSLYLIHWPIYAYWKLTANGSQNELIVALISSVILAVITFETFEKWYLRLSSTNIGVMVVILFVLNVVVINKDEIRTHFDHRAWNSSRLDGLTYAMTLDDAEELNYRWSTSDRKNLFTPSCIYESVDNPHGWCRHTGLSPNGTYKIALLGNSWAANHATLFYQECAHKAKSIMHGAAYACEPFYPTWRSKVCTANFTDFEERVKKEKPDIGFILTRFMSAGEASPANETALGMDSIYDVMRNQTMKLLENIGKKLYILDAVPRVWAQNLQYIAPMLKNGTDPVEVDKKVLEWSGYKIARGRYARLKKDCGKRCEFIDYTSTFFNKTTNNFRYFDEKGFSYFTTSTHLSPHGLELVRPIWKELCAKM